LGELTQPWVISNSKYIKGRPKDLPFIGLETHSKNITDC